MYLSSFTMELSRHMRVSGVKMRMMDFRIS